MITKPRSQRAWQISQEEHDAHHWLGRLSMCLAITSHDLPTHLKDHARKTLDEFCKSSACSESLAEYVKEPR